MPFIRSLAFECRVYIIATILLLGEIMPIYSCCTKKKLVCIIIITPSGHQPFFYIKYTKLNMYLSCNIRSVSNAEYL